MWGIFQGGKKESKKQTKEQKQKPNRQTKSLHYCCLLDKAEHQPLCIFKGQRTIKKIKNHLCMCLGKFTHN